MSYAYRYVRNRLVFALVMVVLAAAFAWWYFPQGTAEQRLVTATVIEVKSSTVKNFRTGENSVLETVTVRLEDGREVVLPVLGRAPQRGDRVTLLELTYPEGEVRYTLRPVDESF